VGHFAASAAAFRRRRQTGRSDPGDS